MEAGIERLRRTVRSSGGQGAAAALTAAIEPVLTEAAGQGGRTVSPQSLALDIAHPIAAELNDIDLTVEAWVERAARTLVFVAGEARTADGRLAAAISGVFRVAETRD